MQKLNEKQLRRVIDANFNRAKEGLRVCEDVCRFVLNDGPASRSFKTLRHQLTTMIAKLTILQLIEARDIDGDVGRGSSLSEMKRKHIDDIFFANIQRIKESIRVLEEFTKLFNVQRARGLKQIRYKVYALEKKVAERF
ncbi:MAG: thiamine-phosphate pyrophosphorylase [Candidatus Omnitrophota bacterium]|nr:thiamine-phosphate pyrophosphorylase [Candidatus Omnitrophota bacterium]